MNKVYDLKEAREWFDRNIKGDVICVDGRNGQLVVNSYQSAEKFFNRNYNKSMT